MEAAATAVHVVVGEHADLVELLAGAQVGLVEDQHRCGRVRFLGGEQVAGLQDQAGPCGSGDPAGEARTMWVWPRSSIMGLGR